MIKPCISSFVKMTSFIFFWSLVSQILYCKKNLHVNLRRCPTYGTLYPCIDSNECVYALLNISFLFLRYKVLSPQQRCVIFHLQNNKFPSFISREEQADPDFFERARDDFKTQPPGDRRFHPVSIVLNNAHFQNTVFSWYGLVRYYR